MCMSARYLHKVKVPYIKFIPLNIDPSTYTNSEISSTSNVEKVTMNCMPYNFDITYFATAIYSFFPHAQPRAIIIGSLDFILTTLRLQTKVKLSRNIIIIVV